MEDVHKWCEGYSHRTDEANDLLTGNCIENQRKIGIGVVSAEETLNRGFSGVMTCGSGSQWYIREIQPYDAYDKIEFDVPIGTNRDPIHQIILCCFSGNIFVLDIYVEWKK